MCVYIYILMKHIIMWTHWTCRWAFLSQSLIGCFTGLLLNQTHRIIDVDLSDWILTLEERPRILIGNGRHFGSSETGTAWLGPCRPCRPCRPCPWFRWLTWTRRCKPWCLVLDVAWCFTGQAYFAMKFPVTFPWYKQFLGSDIFQNSRGGITLCGNSWE